MNDRLRFAQVLVRRRLNETSRLNSLPTEILTSIFLFVRDCNNRPLDRGELTLHHIEPEPDTRSLLVATHLCHRLRAIALAFPPLWSTVPHSVHRKFVLTLVERSGCHRLRVFGDRSGLFRSSGTPVCQAPHHARIEELYLAQRPLDVSNFRLLAAVADHLVYLNVIVAPNYEYPHWIRSVIPRPYFRTRTPKALRALAFSLKAGLYPVDHFVTLAHIRICGTDIQFKARDLLRLLANTPVLETLYLVDTPLRTLDHDWERNNPVPTVQLNHLRALSFDNTGLEVAFAILRHLEFPQDATVQLHRLQYAPNMDVSGMFLPALADFTTLEIMEQFPALHMRAHGERGGFWVHFTTKLSTPIPAFRTLVPIVLQKFLNSLDTMHTMRVGGTTIALGGHQETRPDFLEMVLSKVAYLMPNLSTLFVASDGLSGVDLTSCLYNMLLPSGVLQDIPFPALDTLCIPDTLPTAMDEPLLHLLSERARLGCHIRNLNVRIPREEEEDGALSSSGLADYVEELNTRCITWDPEKDLFWRIDNEYWTLYPEGSRRLMDEVWGLPLIWRG